MSLQRQHFLLNYLKILSIGPAGAWTHDLPQSGPLPYQQSYPFVHTFVRSFFHSFFHRLKVGQAGMAAAQMEGRNAVLELSPDGPEWAIPGVLLDNEKSSYLDFSYF